MQDLMKNAGNIFEELEEAEEINTAITDGIWTITAECGGAFTIYCC